MYEKYVKRFLDIILSLLGIIICIPFWIVLYVIVRADLGTPVLFRQERVTRDNRIFTMYKFRTMKEIRDERGELLPNEERISRIGAVLRSLSLDELPELFNVLKGDISLIGPRPLPPQYLSLYSDFEIKRHRVLGGLIPPEVLYHNITPGWEEQFQYEVYYAEHVSFWLDVKILSAVLKGIYKRNKEDYGNYNRESLSEYGSRRQKKETKSNVKETE